MGMRTTWLYLLETQNPGRRFYKVGVTTNLPARINSLQTGCPHKLRLVAKLGFKFEQDARDQEKRFIDNAKLYGKFYRGEWIYPQNRVSPCILMFFLDTEGFDLSRNEPSLSYAFQPEG